MGRPTVITEKVKDYIRAHHGKMSKAQMARNLGISFMAVQNFMINENLNKPLVKKTVRQRVAEVGHFFQVHSRENWLV